jgi:hypothetical protein
MSISNKKYKILKSNSSLLNLTHIFKNNSLLAFFQIKHLNFKDFIELKKTMYLLNFKVVICKNAYLKKKISLLNIPINFISNVTQGKLLIVYSINELGSLNSSKVLLLNFFQNNLKLIPLFFYFCKKIIFLNNFVSFLKLSEKDMFAQLIYLLENNNKNVINNILTSNKKLVNTLEHVK